MLHHKSGLHRGPKEPYILDGYYGKQSNQGV